MCQIKLSRRRIATECSSQGSGILVRLLLDRPPLHTRVPPVLGGDAITRPLVGAELPQAIIASGNIVRIAVAFDGNQGICVALRNISGNNIPYRGPPWAVPGWWIAPIGGGIRRAGQRSGRGTLGQGLTLCLRFLLGLLLRLDLRVHRLCASQRARDHLRHRARARGPAGRHVHELADDLLQRGQGTRAIGIGAAAYAAVTAILLRALIRERTARAG